MGADFYLVNHRTRHVLALERGAGWLWEYDLDPLVFDTAVLCTLPPGAPPEEWQRVFDWLFAHGHGFLVSEEAPDPWQGEASGTSAPGWVVEDLQGNRWPEGEERHPVEDRRVGVLFPPPPPIVAALGVEWSWWPRPQEAVTLVLHRSGLHLVVSSFSLDEIPEDAARAIAAELAAAIARGVTGRVGVSMRQLLGTWLVTVEAQQ